MLTSRIPLHYPHPLPSLQRLEIIFGRRNTASPQFPTTAKFKNLIQYTILAATTVQKIAEITKVPFLVSTAALSLSITKCIEVSTFLWPSAHYLRIQIDN
jgi:hypothetical protein